MPRERERKKEVERERENLNWSSAGPGTGAGAGTGTDREGEPEPVAQNDKQHKQQFAKTIDLKVEVATGLEAATLRLRLGTFHMS